MTDPSGWFGTSQLEQLLTGRAEQAGRLDARCAALLERVRRVCPGAVPLPPPKPGGLAEPVVLKGAEVDTLLRAALAEDQDQAVLLTDGDDELLVDPGRTRTIVGPGLLLVVLAVDCDQTGPAEVTVAFALGSDQLTTGMLAVTEQIPRGPVVVVGRWGEALVALAWEAVLTVAAGLTRHAGSDVDVLPLVPGALLAERGLLTVVPQARHEADRPGRR